MSIRPKQFARIGEFYLEEAVLDVLFETRRKFDEEGAKKEYLGPADISRGAGIFREPVPGTNSGTDTIVWGILNKLLKDGRVEKCNKPKGYKITDKEYVSRKD